MPKLTLNSFGAKLKIVNYTKVERLVFVGNLSKWNILISSIKNFEYVIKNVGTMSNTVIGGLIAGPIGAIVGATMKSNRVSLIFYLNNGQTVVLKLKDIVIAKRVDYWLRENVDFSEIEQKMIKKNF